MIDKDFSSGYPLIPVFIIIIIILSCTRSLWSRYTMCFKHNSSYPTTIPLSLVPTPFSLLCSPDSLASTFKSLVNIWFCVCIKSRVHKGAKSMHHLSLWDWLLLLNIISSSCSRFPANNRTSYFFFLMPSLLLTFFLLWQGLIRQSSQPLNFQSSCLRLRSSRDYRTSPSSSSNIFF